MAKSSRQRRRERREIEVHRAHAADRAAIWQIMRAIIREGDSYALPRNMSRRQALALWFAPGTRTYVAIDEAGIVGTHILKPNQKGGGDHVANAAFMVSERARGKGVGRVMAEHCFAEARRLRFRAMQFNFVIATNKSAIELWHDFGMKIVGTLPKAFRHPTRGYVDAYIMYRCLSDC